MTEKEAAARDGVRQSHFQSPRLNFTPERTNRPEDRQYAAAGEERGKSRVSGHARRLAELMIMERRREDLHRERGKKNQQRQRLRENLPSRRLQYRAELSQKNRIVVLS